ncbi:hypothetical protein BT67DRAFT_442746 [Trichocladium antarcticum]|uniref:Uncharacterized protein n=1 Tax=Trichocladium antarcticum TaxID=1450529 RepID=A0AAN6ZCX4_9PEZI|nr:hypothetical protein BT67DRAFT_442746 [Trichocladium antarcticum]
MPGKDSNLRYTPSPLSEQRGTKYSSLPQTHLLTPSGSYIVREAYSEGGYTTLLENEISAPKDARLPLFATSA